MILKNNKELKQKDFKNEKELQTYFERNLKRILNCDFIETEFTVGNFRIDTLAFDEENNAFKIIEFKNVKNHSLIDQGYTYLKLLLERKADFVLKYNQKTNKNKSIEDIDWSQTRIVFVSPIFTPYQLNATDFKNIPVDLIKVTRYEEDIIDIEFIKKTSNIKVEELNIVSDNEEVNREIKVYTEEDHLSKTTEVVKGLYNTLKEKILELDDIDMVINKIYIAFKGSKNICDLEIYKGFVQVTINIKKGSITDPGNVLSCYILDDGKRIGHHGNGDYYYSIKKEEDIDLIMPFIKQSLNINKK